MARIISTETIAHGGTKLIDTSRKAIISANTAAGKTTTCGQPYFVNGALIQELKT
jgi:hypothetical protein